MSFKGALSNFFAPDQYAGNKPINFVDIDGLEGDNDGGSQVAGAQRAGVQQGIQDKTSELVSKADNNGNIPAAAVENMVNSTIQDSMPMFVEQFGMAALSMEYQVPEGQEYVPVSNLENFIAGELYNLAYEHGVASTTRFNQELDFVLSAVSEALLTSAELPWISTASSYAGKEGQAVQRWTEKGAREIPRFHKNAGLSEQYGVQSTPWCGSYMGQVMLDAGITPPNGSAGVINWKTWGQEVTKPVRGAVGLVEFEDNNGNYQGVLDHVVLILGEDKKRPDRLIIVGGNQTPPSSWDNQGSAVTVSSFKKDWIKFMRFPGGYNIPYGRLPKMTENSGVTQTRSSTR